VVILYSNRTGRSPLFLTVGASTAGDDNTYSVADLSARRFQTTDLSVTGGRYSFLVHSAYVPAYFRHDHRGPGRLGSDGVQRRSRDPRCPTAGRRGWLVTVDTYNGLDSADTATGHSDPGGRRRDTGRQRDTGWQRDTGMLQARRRRPW
jgi:hypothetical protein